MRFKTYLEVTFPFIIWHVPVTIAHNTPSPSIQPSALPSVEPSVAPTFPPSAGPSTSAIPSAAPSAAPSSKPSLLPSFAPSTVPSTEPSATPSVLPSDHPSVTPSETPSLHPTDLPSLHPSFKPTIEESSHPTITDSQNPTLNPSRDPSVHPTSYPSSYPTKTTPEPAHPTDSPSPIPSLDPTSSHSFEPTHIMDLSTNPSNLPTVSRNANASLDTSSMPRECSAYAACQGLIDPCCPTQDDVFLYCCFEPEENVGDYQQEFTLVDNGPGASPQATYFVSTSTYFDPATLPNGDFPVINYVRDPNEVYDLIYFQTDAIPDANAYVTSNKKFYIDLWSTAPPCTQIILQLDNLGIADPENYPTGRHSRYMTATTKQNEWERLEFDFLDRPDGALGDDQVDSFALFFSPGLNRADSYFFRNLDSAKKGCSTNRCERPSIKSCSALYEGEDGACSDGIDNDNDGLVDCADSECSTDPSCTSHVRLAYASATSKVQIQEAAVDRGSSAATVLGAKRMNNHMAMVLALALGQWVLCGLTMV